MKTIFLQLLEDDYNLLVDNLCGCHASYYGLINTESDPEIKKALIVERERLETLMETIGDQGSSQCGIQDSNP